MAFFRFPLALAGMFALALSTRAQALVTDLVPDSLVDGCCYTDLSVSSVLDLDLDGDGLAELRIEAGRYTLVDGPDTTRISRVFARALDSAFLATVPGGACPSDSCARRPLGLAAGDLIDGAMPLSDTAGFLALSREAPDGTVVVDGDWLDGADHFLGLRYTEGGLPRYAWIQVACPQPDRALVRAFAVNDPPGAPLAAGATGSTVPAGRPTGLSGADGGEAFDGRDLRVSFNPAADESGVAAYRLFAVRGADVPAFTVAAANAAPPDRYLELAPTGLPADTAFGAGALDSRGVPIGNWKPYRLVALSVAGGPANANALSAPSGPVLLQPTATAYTDPDPDPVIDGCCHPDLSSATLGSLDLDGDGRDELRFRAGWYPALAAPVQMSWVEPGDSARIGAVAGSPCGSDSCDWLPLAFADGDLLDGALPLEAEGGYLWARRSAAGDTLRRGNWRDAAEHLLYLRFQSAGLSYRGWVRLVTPEPHRIVIRDYAWSPFPEAPLLAGDTAPAVPAGRATALAGEDVADLGDGRDFRLAFNRAADESGVAEYRLMAVPLGLAGGFGISEANAVAPGRYLPVAPTGANVDTVFGAGALDVTGAPIADWNLYQAVVLSVAGGPANGNALSAPSGVVALAPAAGIGTATVASWSDRGDRGHGEDLGLRLAPAPDETPVLFYGVVAVKEAAAGAFTLAEALALPVDRYLPEAPTGDTIATRLNAASLDADGDPVTEDQPYRLFALTFPRPEASFQRALSPPSAPVILRETDVTPIVAVDVGNDEAASDIAVTFFAQPGIDGLEGWRLILLRASDSAGFVTPLAQALTPDRYTFLPAGAPTELVRLDPGQREAATGAPVAGGFRYVVYVLAELADPPFPDDVLSGPSPVIVIDGASGETLPAGPAARIWRSGGTLAWALDPAWIGARGRLYDATGRVHADWTLDAARGRRGFPLPGVWLLELEGAAGRRAWRLAP